VNKFLKSYHVRGYRRDVWFTLLDGLMVKAYIAKPDVWDEFLTFSDPQSENPPPPAPCDSRMFRFMIMFASCFALLLNCL